MPNVETTQKLVKLISRRRVTNAGIDPVGLRLRHVAARVLQAKADVPGIATSSWWTPTTEIGVKGLEEIGTTGVAAAVANAVFYATAVRARDLPIALDKILQRPA